MYPQKSELIKGEIMKQGIQCDFKDQNIKKYGCYLLCLFELAERFTKQVFTVEMITNLKNTLLFQGLINENCFVKYPDKVLSWITGNRYDFKRGGRDDREEGVILELTKPNFQHFVVLNHNNDYWDPLPPDRAGAAGYSPASTRLFWRKKGEK